MRLLFLRTINFIRCVLFQAKKYSQERKSSVSSIGKTKSISLAKPSQARIDYPLHFDLIIWKDLHSSKNNFLNKMKCILKVSQSMYPLSSVQSCRVVSCRCSSFRRCKCNMKYFFPKEFWLNSNVVLEFLSVWGESESYGNVMSFIGTFL